MCSSDLCNGRTFVSEPEWTRVRPSLRQKSIIDYIISDSQVLSRSGNVCVVSGEYRISETGQRAELKRGRG